MQIQIWINEISVSHYNEQKAWRYWRLLFSLWRSLIHQHEYRTGPSSRKLNDNYITLGQYNDYRPITSPGNGKDGMQPVQQCFVFWIELLFEWEWLVWLGQFTWKNWQQILRTFSSCLFWPAVQPCFQNALKHICHGIDWALYLRCIIN